MISFFAAPCERSLSVTRTRGARHCRFSSLRSSRLAAFLFASALNQNIEHDAVLVDGAPETMLLAGDRHDHLAG